MTELEKAKNNRFHDIDHGKLVEEAAEKINLHLERVADMQKKGFDTFIEEVKSDDIICEAETLLYTLNAIINRLPLSGATIPQYVAALNALGQLLTGSLNERQKALAEGIGQILSAKLLGVTCVKAEK